MGKYAAFCCKAIMKVVKIMNALVYLRVSTEEQAEKGYSLQAQRTEGVNKAAELGCSPENVYVFSDEGVSGAVLERPQLMAALDMLKKGDSDIEYFICYDSSRLSRNAAHQLIIIDEIKKTDVKLIFLKNHYQDNAEGRFQLTVMAAVDEYERARLKLRTEMGKRAKASRHKLTHNPGLYGYDFDPVTDTLNINKEHAQNLRLIFRMLVEEHIGPAEIAVKLNESGVPSPRMKQWNRVTVRRMLANPSYLGILYIRRYDTRDYHLNKFRKKGEKIKIKEKPRDEWIPVEIPEIIDMTTWEKAQNILNSSKHSNKKRDKADFLFSTLLRCGKCGSLMSTKSIVKGSSSYRYYICRGEHIEIPEEKGASILIRAENLEKTVWDYVCSCIFSFINNEGDLKEAFKEYLCELESDIRNIISKNEKAKKERERIITMYQKLYINEAEMKSKLENHEKRVAELDAEEARKSGEYRKLTERIEEDWNGENVPYIIQDILNGLDNEDKIHIIRLLISEISIADDTVSIRGSL